MSVNSKMTAIANAIRNLKSIAGRTLTLDDMASEIGAIGKLPAQTYTPGTADQTIAAGQYLSGAQTVKGDANLIAANIRSGKSIFGVAGSLTPGITPSGTKNITVNGTYDVTEFASAAVNVKNRSHKVTVTFQTGSTAKTFTVAQDDVFAAHRADTNAFITIKLHEYAGPRAVSFYSFGNHNNPRGDGTSCYGTYTKYTSSQDGWSQSVANTPINADTFANNYSGQMYVDASGNLKAHCDAGFVFLGTYDIIMFW